MTRRLLLSLLLVSACSDSSSGPVEPPPDPGVMRVQISGAVQVTGEWQAYGIFRDLLASDANDLSLLGGQNIGDSSFTLLFPGRLDVGQFAMGRYVPGVTPAIPAAFIIFDSTFYASIPGGTLAVTSAEYPARPGLVSGLLRGTVTFKAVRVDAPDTITVHATFAAHWSHYLRPNVSVTLNGPGPVTGTSQFSTALSEDDEHGGRFVQWQSDFGPQHTFPHDIGQELRLAAPGVGTFAVTPLTPAQFANPSAWPAVYTALFYRDDARLGLSAGGTLTITRFLAPTDEFYGEIDGTLTAPIALWVNDSTVSADTVSASIRFAVQLWPLGGIPAGSPKPVP